MLATRPGVVPACGTRRWSRGAPSCVSESVCSRNAGLGPGRVVPRVWPALKRIAGKTRYFRVVSLANLLVAVAVALAGPALDNRSRRHAQAESGISR